jgi:phage-related protein
MRNFPAEFIARKNRISNSAPWVWLAQIQMDTTLDTGFFVTDNNVCITFLGDDYDPYPMSLSSIGADLEGTIQRVTITIQDVLQKFMPYIIEGQGLTGNTVLLRLVNLEPPFTDSYDITFIIDEVETDDTSIILQTSIMVSDDTELPAVKFLKDFCHWEFLGTECGVNAGVPNTGQTCTKRLDGTFGCRYWGDQEVLAAFPRQHPKRFGAFPDLPTGEIFEV